MTARLLVKQADAVREVLPTELSELRGTPAWLDISDPDDAEMNLIADELLWRAGLDPARPAGSLEARDVRRLHRHLAATMTHVLAGGSHTGALMPERRPGGVCPKDGTPLVRRTIGGRTTWSCPTHQL